ncbi:hydrogenase maturation nickel metallochaperone HypA [Noviherbaspirillum sp. ST9]|uniref:hydrogenase maturation nickel metallochaperone HypA n=1 Tax=Noviherbaspirillum sp. ST9 TaxID=3401606 RepID=UPI003B588B22
MHELSLAESVIQIIEDAAVAQQFTKVRAVWIEVGSLAGVEPDAMRFCFDAVTRDTLAEGARLEIVEVPGKGTCPECGSVHPVANLIDACPQCGSVAVQVEGGRGLRVKELDVV